MNRQLAVILPVLCFLVHPAHADERFGHSRHGNAFDSGFRQRPWRMEGIGSTHFPITTKVPEVQEWFDQGNTLLHSFWFEETERSFRWCLKLDPDCAMAYWGLAQTGLNWFYNDEFKDRSEIRRAREFLSEAVRRKESVTPRERMYIDAWEAAFLSGSAEPLKVLTRRLQEIVLTYPDDVEAQARLALYSIDPAHAYGTEMVIRQVLASEPDHPGAHHYRIHNWDMDEFLTRQALESCRRYGQIAPNIGHANHMPGHNYSKLGMWHEAAISMDAATRVELRYMNERMALPFETWNYAHNRNYLCYIQEQLGMERASIDGARALIAAPRDPELNEDDFFGNYNEGMHALVRCLIKFERWDAILAADDIPWRDTPSDQAARAFAETVAYTGQGKLVDARSRLAALRAAIGTDEEKKPWDTDFTIAADAAEGLLRAAEGDLLEATRLLTQAAALEQKQREAGTYPNDPPSIPWPVYRVLGDVYLAHGEPRLAIEAYQKVLKDEPNEAFSLSGLARANLAIGEREQAAKYAGRLAYVWSSADPGLKWQTAVAALDLKPEPIAQTSAPERRYSLDLLANVGPVNWEPYAAPRLDCLDPDGKPVRLEDFRGKNVLLVFYLSEECVHCVEQLVAINARGSEWAAQNTVILGVSSTPPEQNKESAKLGTLSMRLLSDTDHSNARRFASYDDFEDMELHSTILIDANGRVRWKRTGGDPFTDVDFLIAELKRINSSGEKPVARY